MSNLSGIALAQVGKDRLCDACVRNYPIGGADKVEAVFEVYFIEFVEQALPFRVEMVGDLRKYGCRADTILKKNNKYMDPLPLTTLSMVEPGIKPMDSGTGHSDKIT